MKNFSFSLLLLLLLSCNSEEKKSTDTAAQKDSTVNTNASQPAENATATFSLGQFDKNNTALKDSVKGKINEGATWTDADGTFTVLLGQTDNKMVNDQQNHRLYAYCFKKDADAWKRQWLVQDKIENCDVDATCEFFPGSLSVTDNDKNNIGEVTFLYKLSCKGDVSPDEKKLIMYEGLKKYAIRGRTLLEYNGGKEGGEKKIDSVFNSAAKPLLDFANQQWDKFGSTKY